MASRDPFFAVGAEAPYFAIILTWTSRVPAETFEAFIAEIYQEIATAPGFIGLEQTSDADNRGIVLSYWETRPQMMAWLDKVRRGFSARNGWEPGQVFKDFSLRIVRVEQSYALSEARSIPPFV